MLHNSLLKIQQHISLTSGSTLKIIGVANNNKLNHTIKRSNSFHQSSSSDSEGDDTLKKNPYYSSYAKKLKAFKKYVIRIWKISLNKFVLYHFYTFLNILRILDN